MTRAPIADATLATLMDEVATAQARLHAYLVECDRLPDARRPTANGWPESSGHPDLMTVAQAARRQGVSRFTINRWCREDGIGRKYGAHWRVSARRLSALSV